MEGLHASAILTGSYSQDKRHGPFTFRSFSSLFEMDQTDCTLSTT